MPNYMQPITGLLVEKAQAATLPAPAAATDGVPITGWLKSGGGYQQCMVALNADGAATITNPKLYGYGPYGKVTGSAPASQWFYLGDLNNGTAIALSAGVGFAQVVQLPHCFTRLAIGGTVSANNAGYTAVPVMTE